MKLSTTHHDKQILADLFVKDEIIGEQLSW